MALLSIGLGVITAPFTAGLSLAGTALKGFTKVLGFGVNILKAFWRKIKFVALAATVALVGLIYMAAKFEKQMAFVSTMVEDTNKWMGKLAEGVKNLSITFAQSLTAMTQALYDILSASVPVQDALNMLAVSAKAAVAGFTEVTAVGKTLTQVMNAMGISFDQAAAVSDSMFKIVKHGQLEFKQLAGSLSKAMTIAASARVPFEELAASYAFLTRNGRSVAEAQTQIAGAMTAIIKKSAKSEKLAKSLGLELNSTALRTKGLIGVVQDLAKAGLTPEEIVTLFPRRQAFLYFAAAIGGAKELKEDLTKAYHAGGATAEAFAKASDKVWFRFGQFVAAVKVFLIELVTPMLPALKELFVRLKAVGEYLRTSITKETVESIANAAKKATTFVESALFWLMQEVPYVFEKIWGYLKFTIKIIETVLDVGILKTLLGAYWTYLTNRLEVMYEAITGFFRAIGERLYQIARRAWWEVRSFITGEAIPDFVHEFTGLFDYINFELTNRMPDAFKEGWDKAAHWYDEYTRKVDAQYKARGKKLTSIQEKVNADMLRKDKILIDQESKLRHDFENAKINMDKEAIEEIIKIELKKIAQLKALGELSLRDELARLRKLREDAIIGSDEELALAKRIYDIEKGLRQKRKAEVFEHFSSMEAKEREVLRAKIGFLKKYMDEEKLSYQELKEAAIELYKLKRDLRKTEREEQKKLNEFYMLDEWKRLKAQEEILKKRRMLFAEDSYQVQQIDRARDKNARKEAEARAKFVRVMSRKEGKEWTLEGLRKLKVAEAHAIELLKSDKISKKEKAATARKLEKIEKNIVIARKQVQKKEKLSTQELLEKEAQWYKQLENEIAKATGERVDAAIAKEKEAQQKRVQQAKEAKQEIDKLGIEAKEKVKELSTVMYNFMTSTIKGITSEFKNMEAVAVSIFGRLAKMCQQAKTCGIPTPSMTDAQRKLFNGGVQRAGTPAVQQIKTGPIYVGMIDSEVDMKRLADRISESIAGEAGRAFRVP